MRDKIFFSFSVEGKIRMKKQRLWPNWKINAQKWNNHLKRTIFDIWLFEELESEKQKEANFIVMETVKQIPYGMSNFEDVIMQNRYYVDKTMYIPLLEDQANYLIFIRPRRFGKSLLLSMLRSYYDLSQKISSSNYSAISGSVSIQLRFKANTKYFILTFPKSVAVLMNCHKDSILTALCS